MSEKSHLPHLHCDELATERMRYFTGRHMTARDFRDEQSYYLTHRYLHNRMMHGWGVVCGLHVYQHGTEGCRLDRVIVNAGMAVDCCGREIVVDGTVVPPPIPWNEKRKDPEPSAPQELQQPPPAEQAQDEEADEAQSEEAWRPTKDRRWYPLLCLRYAETQIERVPVLYSESGCDEQRREYSRIAEGYEFEWHWVREQDLPDYNWKIVGGRCDDKPKRKHRHDDHDAGDDQAETGEGEQYAKYEGEQREHHEHDKHHEHDEHHEHHDHKRPCPHDDCYPATDKKAPESCLEPSCPPHHCVPLAWIRVKQGQPILTDKIITLGRPSLRPPARSLTHICSINWPHGGVMSRRQLERLRRLEVRFDRRLKRSRHSHDDCGPHGINSCTFDVRFGGGYEDLDFVTSENMPHVVDECVAVYPIDPRGRKNRHDKPFSYLENHTVYITLKCDFILDCHGVPVDGNHMAGLLPSGDGVPGGTFESWFRVVPDHEWKDHDRDDYEREENDNEEKGI